MRATGSGEAWDHTWGTRARRTGVNAGSGQSRGQRWRVARKGEALCSGPVRSIKSNQCLYKITTEGGHTGTDKVRISTDGGFPASGWGQVDACLIRDQTRSRMFTEAQGPEKQLGDWTQGARSQLGDFKTQRLGLSQGSCSRLSRNSR